jgi:hypothetical protein
LPMIEVKSENEMVHVTFPTKGMSPQQVSDFVTWLRVEAIARRSKLTAEAAEDLSEQIKAQWWEKNKQRFGE